MDAGPSTSKDQKVDEEEDDYGGVSNTYFILM